MSSFSELFRGGNQSERPGAAEESARLTAVAYSKTSSPDERLKAQEQLALLDGGKRRSSSALPAFAERVGADKATTKAAEEILATLKTQEQLDEWIAEAGIRLNEYGQETNQAYLHIMRSSREKVRSWFYRLTMAGGVAIAATALVFLSMAALDRGPVASAAAPEPGRPEDMVPDAENSDLPEATAAGKGTGSNPLEATRPLSRTEQITNTQELTPTNALTVTRYIRAEGPDGKLKSFYMKPITIESAVISATTSQSATIEFLSEGTLYTVTVALADMATTFDSSQAITRTSAELEVLVPPVKFVRRVESSPTNLRRGPGTNFPVAGALTNEGDSSEVIETKNTKIVNASPEDIWYRLPDDASGGERWVRSDLVEEAVATGGFETAQRDTGVRILVSDISGVPEDEIKLHPDYTFAEQSADPDDPTKNPPTVATDLEGNVIATIRIIKLPFGYQAEIRSWRDIRLVEQTDEQLQQATAVSEPAVAATATRPVVSHEALPRTDSEVSTRRENHPDKTLWTDVTLMASSETSSIFLSDQFNKPDLENGYWKAISGDGPPDLVENISFQTVDGIQESPSSEWMVNNPETIQGATKLGLLEVDGEGNPIETDKSNFVPGEQIEKSIHTFLAMLRDAGKRPAGAPDHVDVIIHRVVSDYYGESSKAEVVPEDPVVVLSNGAVEVHISVLKPGDWVIQTAILRALTIFLDQQGVSYNDVKDGGLPLASELLSGSYSLVTDSDGNFYLIPGFAVEFE